MNLVRPSCRFGCCLALTLAALAGALSPLNAQVNPDHLSGMTARSIGPAGMSGRITSIDVFRGDPNIVWIGTATGGVWKSENQGTSWTPVFDDQRVSGIGAVAIDPENPDIVWVGTGEGNPRNSAGVGAGVYRTTDGGESWTLLGLQATERIHRIILHPTNPNIAYVGAMGPAWSDGLERGVFMTTDAGETWQNTLFINARTGVSDLVMDPSDPDRLYAGMWEFQRSPSFFASGGPGSGLFISEDAGLTWRRVLVEAGLPEGELGRIGLSVHAADPEIVYALVEAEKSALLRSDDRGVSWVKVTDRPGIAPRPFYYTDIFVDPENADLLYNLHSRMQRSEDGGRTFETISDGVHSDFHALWIDPADPRHLLVGTDGGLFESRDRGDSWRMFDNLPVGQFYHVSVDMETPFNVYGGMQDNGSWRGPSDNWDSQGIRNAQWREVAFGDGFNTIVAPDSPDIGYGMSQGGNLQRLDFRTGERKPIRPWGPDGTPLRFNWNAPIATDPYEPGTIFYGSQFVHRSRNRGDTWQIISPDLTTNNPEWQRQDDSGGLTRDATGAENYTTTLTIAPSAIQQGVIWVGTDDGQVQMTRAGGGSWTNLSDRALGVPTNTWVPHIEASKYRADAAFVVFDDHRRGNWEPYAYAVYDFGNDWRRIIDAEDVDGYVLTLEQDPEVPDLLYAGTEFGLWVSLNRGGNWFRWTHGLPTVPVRSLVVHPRDGDLVIGTFGRAIYILDDVRPLRELALDENVQDEALHLFAPPDAFVTVARGLDGYHFPAAHLFEGERRMRGAMISFWAGPDEVVADSTEARLEIFDSGEQLIRTLTLPVVAGINRVRWDLKEDLPEEVRDEPAGKGAEVVSGTYRLRLTGLGTTTEQFVEVRVDPRVEVDYIDWVSKYQAVTKAAVLQARRDRLRDGVRRVRQAVEMVRTQLGEGEQHPEVAEMGDALLERLDATAKLDELRGLFRTLRGLRSSFTAPTEAERIDLQRTRESLDVMMRAVDDIIVLNVARYRELVQSEGLDVFEEIRMIEGGL
jgi:photosystem II stability/assembly factor-like uncharacterized protein